MDERPTGFQEYECFRLKRPLPDRSVPLGTIGVVLLVFDHPKRAYEVEFPDGAGRNLGASPTYTLVADDMESV